MPIQQVNELLAAPWDPISAELCRRLCAAVEERQWQFRLAQQRIPLLGQFRITATVHDVRIEPNFTSPPAYTALAPDAFAISIPADPAGWSIRFTARLTLSVQSPRDEPDQYDSLTIPLSGRFHGLRLDVDARLDRSEPDCPVLLTERRVVQPSLLAEISGPDGEEARVTRIGGKKPRSILSRVRVVAFQARASLRAERPAAVVLEGNLELRLRVAAAELPIRLPFRRLFAIERRLPGVLGPLIAGGKLPPLPQEWGERELRLERAPADADFAGPAAKIECAISTHLPYGAVFDLRLTNGHGKSAAVEGYIDSAIWTGHYLAAEAFRYAASRNEAERLEALERIELIVDGIGRLLRVTGRPGLLARAALPDDSPLQAIPPFQEPPEGRHARYYGPASLDGKTWRGYGAGDHPPSRDTYIGVVTGLAYVHHLLKPGATLTRAVELRARAAAQLEEILAFLLRNRWTVPTPPDDAIQTHFLHGFVAQLALLRAGKSVYPERFGEAYDRAAGGADAAWVAVWATCLDPIGSYYKFNLAHAALGLLLVLEDEPQLRELYMGAYRILRRTVRHHRNAYFDLVRVLVEPEEARAALLASHEEGCDPSLTLREQIRAILNEWLQRQQQVASPSGLPTQATPAPESLYALYPESVSTYQPLFPKLSIDGKRSGRSSGTVLARAALPVHLRPGRNMDFVWQRDPFQTGLVQPPGTSGAIAPVVDPGRPDLEGPGIDYLLPYWMGRYLGVLD